MWHLQPTVELIIPRHFAISHLLCCLNKTNLSKHVFFFSSYRTFFFSVFYLAEQKFDWCCCMEQGCGSAFIFCGSSCSARCGSGSGSLKMRIRIQPTIFLTNYFIKCSNRPKRLLKSYKQWSLSTFI